MKKLLIPMAVLAVIALGAGGYFLLAHKSTNASSNSTGSATITASSSNTNEPTLDSVTDKLTKAGIVLGEKTIPYYQTIHAKDGVKYHVGETDIVEIYAYADKAKMTLGKEQLDDGAGNVFTDGNVLILANSTDKDFVARIRAAVE